MRTQLTWSDTAPEKDGLKSVCYDIAFKPDGSELVTAIGNRVLVHETATGDLRHSLRGHKESVYCVSYSYDGKRFASGGADKTVIIWTSKAEGIVKYNHNDSVQVLAYNPLGQELASGTATDLGLWSPELKHVAKHKVASKIVSLSWRSDGQYLALGHYDGQVSIRTRTGEETSTIQQTAPVWTLSWTPSREQPDILTIGCWDGTLSQYDADGKQVGSTRDLGFMPCCVSYMPNGEFICVSGTDSKAVLCTQNGTVLSTLAHRGSWVWCVRGHPHKNCVAVGCQDGSIAVYQLVFSTVHSLYNDQYACRDHMTDVVIKNLTTDEQLRIECKDYVKKLAVYKERLAIQVPKQVTAYELQPDSDGDGMRYKPIAIIQQALDCNLLVVTALHIILCQDCKLQLYSFEGVKEREWVMDSVIRYIKVAGGPAGREGLLLGLKDGQAVIVYVDNAFPVPLVTHHASVRCLDLSSSRRKLALVDDNNKVLVYDVRSKAVMFQDKNANSVAWNTQLEDMLCFSGGGKLSTRTADFPVHQQKMQGFVVGFKGGQVFCLHYNSMQAVEVPQSTFMQGYLAAEDWNNAYKVACLGVPDSQWTLLGQAALQALQLEVASKAFARVQDTSHLPLLHQIEQAQKAGQPDAVLKADVLAYQGKYQEAARAYAKAGVVNRAMDMFSDLRLFAEAKAWSEEWERQKASRPSNAAAGPAAVTVALAQKQAEWSEEMKDFQAAADMYLQAGKYNKAIAIMGQNQWWHKLNQVVSQLSPSNTNQAAALRTCAAFFRRGGQAQFAKEAYVKLQDYAALAELAVEAGDWAEAQRLAAQHPVLKQAVYLPYAAWLLSKDSFQEACQAYRQAGKWHEASHILEQLTRNAIMQHQYGLGASLTHQMAVEALNEEPSSSSEHSTSEVWERHQHLQQSAELYYAYDIVYRAFTSPFNTVYANTLFNATCYLLMHLPKEQAGSHLAGISRAVILRVCAEQAEQLQAFKLARWAYTQLQSLHVPSAWQETLDLASMHMHSRPLSDSEDLLPTCYRCGSSNPLVNPQGDVCNTCNTRLIRSFLSFEPLPLLEFQLAANLTDQQAAALLEQDPEPQQTAAAPGGTRDGADVLQLEDSGDALDLDLDDPFQAQMLDISQPIVADQHMLQTLKQQEVIIQQPSTTGRRCRYYKIMDPATPLCLAACGHFYEEDEYDMYVLEHQAAPFWCLSTK